MRDKEIAERVNKLKNIIIRDDINLKKSNKNIVFIKHRTPEEIEEARKVDLKELKHPEQDEERAKKPEWLVTLGICTHLGCVPLTNKGDYEGGWFCPCHGSHYDTSGRIRSGPAPTNLEIPEYTFVDSNTIKIG